MINYNVEIKESFDDGKGIVIKGISHKQLKGYLIKHLYKLDIEELLADWTLPNGNVMIQTINSKMTNELVKEFEDMNKIVTDKGWGKAGTGKCKETCKFYGYRNVPLNEQGYCYNCWKQELPKIRTQKGEK